MATDAYREWVENDGASGLWFVLEQEGEDAVLRPLDVSTDDMVARVKNSLVALSVFPACPICGAKLPDLDKIVTFAAGAAFNDPTRPAKHKLLPVVCPCPECAKKSTPEALAQALGIDDVMLVSSNKA